MPNLLRKTPATRITPLARSPWRGTIDPMPRRMVERGFVQASVAIAERLIAEREGAGLPRPQGLAVGLYAAHVVLGVSVSDLARYAGASRTRISRLVSRVEDRRDDEAVNRLVNEVEARLRAVVPVAGGSLDA